MEPTALLPLRSFTALDSFAYSPHSTPSPYTTGEAGLRLLFTCYVAVNLSRSNRQVKTSLRSHTGLCSLPPISQSTNSMTTGWYISSANPAGCRQALSISSVKSLHWRVEAAQSTQTIRRRAWHWCYRNRAGTLSCPIAATARR